MIATQFKDIKKTKQTRVLNIIFSLAIGALFLVLLLHSREASAPLAQPVYDATVSNGFTDIPVAVADTDEERELGLSGTAVLPQNAGKLFIFNAPGKYGFWMKDMRYAIDIIWIDESFRIVGIAEGILPGTYPEVFYPPSPVKYVLEVNAGFSTAHNLLENQLLTLTNNLSF
jgi:uncharacterized membrane protein (UPF0127 family)